MLGKTRKMAPLNGTRQASIVAAIGRGTITADEARERYGLSPEEIAAWQRTLDSLGVRSRRKRRTEPMDEPSS